MGVESLRLSGFGTGVNQAKYDLEMTAVEGAQGLRVAIVYCKALFEGVRAERMLRHFGTLLETDG